MASVSDIGDQATLRRPKLEPSVYTWTTDPTVMTSMIGNDRHASTACMDILHVMRALQNHTLS